MMEKMANKKLHADGKASDIDSAHRCQLKDEQSSTAELVSNDSAGEDAVSPRKPLLQYLDKGRAEGCTLADSGEVQDSSTASGATSISGCDDDNYTSSDCQVNSVPRDPYDQGTHKEGAGLCCECANCFPRLSPNGRITTQDIKFSGKIPPNSARSQFATGDIVEGFYRGKWYGARIVERNKDGTYNLLWDDGTQAPGQLQKEFEKRPWSRSSCPCLQSRIRTTRSSAPWTMFPRRPTTTAMRKLLSTATMSLFPTRKG